MTFFPLRLKRAFTSLARPVLAVRLALYKDLVQLHAAYHRNRIASGALVRAVAVVEVHFAVVKEIDPA